MATIGELFVNINARTDNFEQGMNRTRNSANGLNGVFGSIKKTIAGFMMYDLGKKLVGGFVSATKAGIDYNATLETSRIKWETLLGTQGKANKMLKDIEKFASTTPFEKMGIDKMASYLHNAGFEGNNLFNQLTKFGDVAGAFSVTNSDLEEMVRQYSQVRNAGVAYTEDLNILEDKSVPIMKNIAEVMKVPQSEVKKLASEGKISFDIYNQALDNIAKKSEGGMAKMSESFNGIKSTIKDSMGQIAGTLAKPIFDKLKDGAIIIRDKLGELATFLGQKGLMKTIQEFAPAIMPFVQLAINIFKTMGDTVGTIIKSMTGFWNEHKSWLMPVITFLFTFISTIVMNTITAIGSIVQSGLAFIDGVINFFQNLFTGNFSGCWESIKQIFFSALEFVWNLMQVQFALNIPAMIKGFGKGAIGIFKGMWSSVKGFFSGGIKACLGFVKNLLSGAKSSFGTLKAFGANSFQALWTIAKNMMSKLLSSVTSSISKVPTTIKNFMTRAVGVIKGINLFSIGKDMIQGLINGIKNAGANIAGAIGNVVNGAVEATKKKLKIKSPSRVFMEIGKFTGEGLAIGIENEKDRVSKASIGLSKSVIGGYNAKLKGLSGS
ncbi:tape measure protein, partial [Romboutsia sp.]|uniref:tape measure protein n=1 Tax=Romboutsia sp. TaxID=1965302 RepID=UPI002C33ED01